MCSCLYELRNELENRQSAFTLLVGGSLFLVCYCYACEERGDYAFQARPLLAKKSVNVRLF